MDINASENRDGAITASLVISSIVAASSGLIMGYDIGISGGVTTMKPFLDNFFPSVLKKTFAPQRNLYCMYDSHLLTAFTSSLYVAAMAGCLTAGSLTERYGRRNVMLMGGLTFLAGAVLNGFAQNIVMLILGRMLLGIGVGFSNQAAPIYLNEVAPPKLRGAINAGFEVCIGIGVVSANTINYLAAPYQWGWRISLGLAVVPAGVIIFGAFLLNDTPTGLVERGKIGQARKALTKARGSEQDVDSAIAELVKVRDAAKEKGSSLRSVFERKHRPQMVMAVGIGTFGPLTGVTIVAFYAPVLFQSVGFGREGALVAAIILGLFNLLSTIVSMLLVDRCGRRLLFQIGGVQMFICQVAIACILGATAGDSGKTISRTVAVGVLVIMCVYATGYGWSWGPLWWLVPSEILPMNVRAAGQSISVAMNLAVTFMLAQSFLSMLCRFSYGIFLFHAAWITAMTVFVIVLLPETKGMDLESMHKVWEEHWYWRRFVLPHNLPPK